MVSMASLHFFRWTEQLKDSGHEVYWFDILDSGTPSERISWVHQIVGWKHRWDFPGRYFIKNKLPFAYKFIQKINKHNTTHEFEKALLTIQPDVVHSFAMNIAGIPIAPVMSKHEKVKWMLSSWGSDLFYLTNNSAYRNKVKSIIPRVNYIFTDCNRDYTIAKELGFKGSYLGVYPGGGGFDFEEYDKHIIPIKDRKIILIKGFQGEIGRCIQVIKALEMMSFELTNYKIVIFGADKEVINYVNISSGLKSYNITIYEKMTHEQVLKLMGKSLIYIGNSISDGIPNTLLESIVMGAFPIQSNPGNASAEIIKDGVNGLLINNCEDIIEIKSKIEKALNNKELLNDAFRYNMKLREQFEYDFIRKKVLKKYNIVEKELKVRI
jgi:glycosyltransferase involved in cell wall biosynthesis